MFPLNKTWATRLPWLNALHRRIVIGVARWLRKQMVMDSPQWYDTVIYQYLGEWLDVQAEAQAEAEHKEIEQWNT